MLYETLAITTDIKDIVSSALLKIEYPSAPSMNYSPLIILICI